MYEGEPAVFHRHGRGGMGGMMLMTRCCVGSGSVGVLPRRKRGRDTPG
jgi:hypothetical protein